MVELEKTGYGAVRKLYESSELFFPLIAAVLLDSQDGVVYVDDAESPAQAYVEHAFGFAQVFGTCNQSFERELERYLLTDRLFRAGKVRLYAPYLPGFLDRSEHEPLRSFRQRFRINREQLLPEASILSDPAEDFSLRTVDADNVASIESAFGLVRRFWRSTEDFIDKSLATVIMHGNAPASICYAAAQANNRVEIDVLTLPEYRQRGLARHAVADFVRRCFSQSICPLWDCFTNNTGSMELCRSVGFTPVRAPYPFFTIDKHSTCATG